MAETVIIFVYLNEDKQNSSMPTYWDNLTTDAWYEVSDPSDYMDKKDEWKFEKDI